MPGTFAGRSVAEPAPRFILLAGRPPHAATAQATTDPTPRPRPGTCAATVATSTTCSLCPRVDLPLEAGTCGRVIWPESSRCTACRKRRHWLLTQALNPVEVALSALLDGAEADTAEHATDARDDAGEAVPLLDDLPALGDPCLRW